MSTEVRHNADEHRFEIFVDGELAGVTEYRPRPASRTFDHTVVRDEFRDRGLAGELVQAALDATRAEGLAVRPLCPYVHRFIAEHHEYLDLVRPADRATFGLPAE